MRIRKPEINPENDLGFGNQAVTQRVINRDGTINVKRKGGSAFWGANRYHQLITMSWSKFWMVVLTGYLLANLFFASVYTLIGIDHLQGADGQTPLLRFFDAFFFSAQTLSTVGYGHISPKGITMNFVASFESMIGLLPFALATGLLYGRFSRPSAKIAYSDCLLVAPYQDNGRGLMFRLANLRRNILIEVSVEVIFSYNEEVNGMQKRVFFPLVLERKNVSILTLSWTVVHPVDDKSPLKDMTIEDYRRTDASVSVLVKCYDDTFAQTVHSRTSYQANEIVWGARFSPAFHTDETGQVILDLSKISDHVEAELPESEFA